MYQNMPQHARNYLAITGVFLRLAATLTLPLPPSILALTNNTSEYSGNTLEVSEAVCFPPSPWSAYLAETYDCLDAIMMLSTSDQSGLFNSDSVMHDEFSLPVTKTSAGCFVKVSIKKGAWDQSSWIIISHVANQLAQRCSVGYFPRGKSGGYTYTGRDGNIRILLEKTGGPPPPKLLRQKFNGTGIALDTS